VRRCGRWCEVELSVCDRAGNDVLLEGWRRPWVYVLDSAVDGMKDRKLDLMSILYANVRPRNISDGPW